MVAATRRPRRAKAVAYEADSDADEFEEPSEVEYDEDDEVPAPKKRSRTQARRSKRPRVDPDFEENTLYTALSSPDIAVSDLALEWVENFMEDEENNTNNAFTELFNLLLRCCGCTSLAQPHDLINSDSAAITVAELALLFEKQRLHEYPFISSNKEIKFFRRNVLQFFGSIVTMAHEKGALYASEDSEVSSLMTTLLAWLSALSASTIRSFRYVATSIILVIQTELCEQSISVTVLLEKQQRQLNNAKGNTKTKRKAQEKKIEAISESVNMFHSQKDTLLEYMSDIVQTVFIHRYRDVDGAIRTECLRALGQWMTINEEVFFLSTYLRYLGWLLSDPVDIVREEVIKVLHRLYKHSSSMGIGFRQFTERFKKQLINMVWKEKLATVKIQLFGIYTELFKFGFMSTEETHEVGSYGFYLAEAFPATLTNEKVKLELCKFISCVSSEKTRAELEKYSVLLTTQDSEQFGDEEGKLQLERCLRHKLLVGFLRSSYSVYTTSRRLEYTQNKSSVPPRVLVESLFQGLYTLPEFTGDWEFLIRYLIYDLSSIKFTPKAGESTHISDSELNDLKDALELSADEDKYFVMSLIAGAVGYILKKKPSRKLDAAEDPDDLQNALPKLAPYLHELEAILSKGRNVYPVFMRIWNMLLQAPVSLFKIFNDMGRLEEYDSLHGGVLRFFQDAETSDSDLSALYDEYFAQLLKHFDGREYDNNLASSERLLNGSISIKVEDLLLALATEAIEVLNSRDLIPNIVDEEDDAPDVEDQKELCNSILKVSSPLSKLSQLSTTINVNRFVAEPILDSPVSVLELLSVKLLSKVDFVSLVQHWPNNLLKLLPQLITGWKTVLSFILSSLCWKLEDLMYASNDNSALTINIDVFLDDFSQIVPSIIATFIDIDRSIKKLNEGTSDGDSSLKQLILKLVELDAIFGAEAIDMLVSVRVFYKKLLGSNSFRNFNEFFEDKTGFGKFIQGSVLNDLELALMNVFFVKEASLAALLNISLDRGDDEDVNVEDLVVRENTVISEVPREPATFDSSDESDSEEAELRRGQKAAELEIREKTAQAEAQFKRDQLVWFAEKNLCVFVVKLCSLINAGGLSESAWERLQLNGTELGGLFTKILTLNKESAQPAEFVGDILDTEE